MYRENTKVIQIGNRVIGGGNPVLIQYMCNTKTENVEATVAQILKLEEAGCEIIRVAVPTMEAAAAIREIKKQIHIPLVADIHFNPKAAEVAALYVEKVRINPGNFVDRVHTLNRFEYTDEEYQLEIEKIRTKLLPLLAICRENHTAIRIGVNHGSLSDRILSRYGDTPNGMVESCLEFLRICKEEQFLNVVISIKASNTVIMVQTVRLLVARMNEEGMKFPLHLGVTEAGDGEDGRVKSALGIGALLADGLGDTIRVSLSENPECEIPVARKLVNYVSSRIGHDLISAKDSGCVNPFVYQKRATCAVNGIGANNVPVVSSSSIITSCCIIISPVSIPSFISCVVTPV